MLTLAPPLHLYCHQHIIRALSFEMAPAKMNAVTFFNNQFPNADCTETCDNVMFDHDKNRYIRFNLDIGWALRPGHSNRISKGDDPFMRLYDRVCCGYSACDNPNCAFQGIELRPGVEQKVHGDRIEKQCKLCNQNLKAYPCPVRVYYKFTMKECVMTHKGTHSHGIYERKHLSEKQNKEIEQFVERYPNIEPKAATVGVDPQTCRVIQPISDIDPCLQNYENGAYEMRQAKQRIGLPTSQSDPFTAFHKIENDHPHYITDASIMQQQFCIAFRVPTIEIFLNFARYPIAMDITYKAVKGWYLCSSVIFSPEIKKHIVFFQAILKGTSTSDIQQYFSSMFRIFKLDFDSDNVLGVIMDFSQAQINAFLNAYSTYTGRNDGLKYLKGCYMHWMQSVKLVSSNHSMVPPQHRKSFLRCTYNLRTATCNQEFNLQLLVMITQCPPTWKWIKWWLQPKI